jgi:hypothetical protein
MRKWMMSIDQLAPGKAFELGGPLADVNPKNLILTAGAAAGLAQLGLSTSDAVVSLIVFVVIGSLTIATSVVYSIPAASAPRPTWTPSRVGWPPTTPQRDDGARSRLRCRLDRKGHPAPHHLIARHPSPAGAARSDDARCRAGSLVSPAIRRPHVSATDIRPREDRARSQCAPVDDTGTPLAW